VRAKLSRAIPDVKQARNQCRNARSKFPGHEELRGPSQQNPQHKHHLQYCSQFANEPGPHGDFADCHHYDTDTRQEQDIPPDDCAREPEGDRNKITPVLEAQENDRRNQQEFVRKRVENGAELAALVLSPGDIAIHAVADSSDCETENRHSIVQVLACIRVIEDFDHENRDQQDAQNRDFVSGGHEET